MVFMTVAMIVTMVVVYVGLWYTHVAVESGR